MGNERLPESITRNEVMADSMPEAGNHVKHTKRQKRSQGTGLNGAKLRGYCHLNRNRNPHLDLNLLMENGLRWLLEGPSLAGLPLRGSLRGCKKSWD
jgi:hypothetical protein